MPLDSARFTGVVLTIGNFDGVHLGHRTILEAGRRRADAAGTQLVAMTFEPHPATVLTPDRVPAILTPLEEKIRWLGRGGLADAVVVVASTPEFFGLSAEAFIDDVIVGRFHPIALVEGEAFRFGQHRAGDVDMLRAAGRERGFDVEIVPPVRAPLGGQPDTVVSSSLIRHLLRSGNVDHAAVCLGRPYTLVGRVITGAGRGKPLGFPTANLAVEPQLVPAEGVYAGRACVVTTHPPAPVGDAVAVESVAPSPVAAAVSIGRNPTFDGSSLAVEAHLLDWQGDLYDQTIRIEFLAWLRPQRKFDSPEQLRAQIESDIARIRQAASEPRP